MRIPIHSPDFYENNNTITCRLNNSDGALYFPLGHVQERDTGTESKVLKNNTFKIICVLTEYKKTRLCSRLDLNQNPAKV